MSKKGKLLDRFLSRPKDFTFKELKTLLKHLGYVEVTLGKTAGNRVMFYDDVSQHAIRLHKPHPRNVLKSYQVNQVIDELKTKGKLR